MSYFKYQSKNIFYSKTGAGIPLIFLHGNTASSKMFECLLPLYQEHFEVIVIDFLGNGQSDRLEKFPVELWFEQALQTIALIDYLGYNKVNLVGTSGGAWVAINVALERPDLVTRVVADSFDGRTLHEGFSAELLKARTQSKNDTYARQFYELCQGSDWERIIDCDTEALVQFAKRKLPLFHRPLCSLQVPILLMGSQEDPLVRENLSDEYQQMSESIANAGIHLFKTGGHPSIITNAIASFKIIQAFIE